MQSIRRTPLSSSVVKFSVIMLHLLIIIFFFCSPLKLHSGSPVVWSRSQVPNGKEVVVLHLLNWLTHHSHQLWWENEKKSKDNQNQSSNCKKHNFFISKVSKSQSRSRMHLTVLMHIEQCCSQHASMHFLLWCTIF